MTKSSLTHFPDNFCKKEGGKQREGLVDEFNSGFPISGSRFPLNSFTANKKGERAAVPLFVFLLLRLQKRKKEKKKETQNPGKTFFAEKILFSRKKETHKKLLSHRLLGDLAGSENFSTVRVNEEEEEEGPLVHSGKEK